VRHWRKSLLLRATIFEVSDLKAITDYDAYYKHIAGVKRSASQRLASIKK